MNPASYASVINRLYQVRAALPAGLSEEESETVRNRIDELIWLLNIQIDGVILDEIGHG